MKKHFLQFGALLLATSLTVVSCVETEELDSVKAMREAKTNSLVADTQIKMANLAAIRIQNSYDSINNAYNLEVSKANTDAAVVEAKARLERANATLAAEVENSKRTLSQAIVSLRTQQIAEIAKQNEYNEELLNNPEKKRLTDDYNLFYNGNGTTTDGIVITSGIYALKADIIAKNKSKLGLLASKESMIETDANAILTLKASIRQDSVDIANFNRILAIGLAAKNTQDYSAAYSSLVTLFNSAFSEYNNKKEEATLALNTKDLANAELVNATATYNANDAKKTTALTAMNTILTTYSVASLDGLNVELDALKASEANALKTKNDADNKVNIWKNNYSTVNAELVSIEGKRNAAFIAMQMAQYQVDTADVAAPGASTTLNDSLTSKTTKYNNLVIAYNAAKTTYDAVDASYAAAQTAQKAANTAYATAQTNTLTLVTKIESFNSNKVIYDAAVAAESGLLAIKKAKADALSAANATLTLAQAAETSANTYYVAVNSSKTSMKGVMDGIYSANAAIDATEASTRKSIAEKENDIEDLKLQIARVGDINTYNYDEEIELLNEKIAVATSLLTVYEKKADDLAKKIALL